jgi:hypothetical protein
MGFGKISKKKKSTKQFFNRLFKGKPVIPFLIFLKRQQKYNNDGIKRFIYFKLIEIHINIVEKCYQLALNEK